MKEEIVIGYVTVGTNNFSKAVAFYVDLFAEIGAGRFMQEDRFVAWAVAPDQPGSRSECFYAACFRDLDGNKLNVFFM